MTFFILLVAKSTLPEDNIKFWETGLGEKILISLIGIIAALLTTFIRDKIIDGIKRKNEKNQIIISALKDLLEIIEEKMTNPSIVLHSKISDNQYFIKLLQKNGIGITKIKEILKHTYLQRDLESDSNQLVLLKKTINDRLIKKIES